MNLLIYVCLLLFFFCFLSFVFPHLSFEAMDFSHLTRIALRLDSFASHGLSICANLPDLYIDSPPRRSPGKYKLSELGVVLCVSPLSITELLHNEFVTGGAPHNCEDVPLHVSGGGPDFLVPLMAQPVLPLAPVCGCAPPAP